MKYRLTGFLLLFACFAAFSQSNKQWLFFADSAFEAKDYASAAAYYLKALKKDTLYRKSLRDVTYPYQLRPYIPKYKPGKDSSLLAKSDSVKVLMPDSSIRAKTDTTGKTLAAKPKVDSVSAAKPPLPLPAPQAPKNDAVTDTSELVDAQYVIHQVAECYRLNHDYDNAELWYAKSLQYDWNAAAKYPFEKYWLGDAMMKNKKYQAAIKEFEGFMKNYKDTLSYPYQKARQNYFSCHLAMDTTNINKKIIVQELDTLFNAGTANFAASFYGSSVALTFTSARKGNTVLDTLKDDGAYTSDIYYTLKNLAGTAWSKPANMGTPFNSENNEGAVSLSPDKSGVYFTRWSTVNRNECDIFITKDFYGKWMTPIRLNQNVNMENYQSKDPCISPDGKILFFSSNRPGGMGKMDLWYCSIDEMGNAGEPVNMGPIVNTPDDEGSPYYNGRSLYFSSAGHPGFGGLDIYKTSSFAIDIFRSIVLDTTWTTPKNLGRPINSSRDDAYFMLDSTEMHGFFSSDRKKCESCGQSGYCYHLYSVENEPLNFSVHGKVYDKQTNEIIANSLITFKDIRSDEALFYVITNDSGAYASALTENVTLYLKAQKNKYFAAGGTVSTVGLTQSTDLVQDIYLRKIPTSDITIPGIEYDYNKATLRPESKKVLDDNLVTLLKENPNLYIEIGSHTDSRGKDEYNLKLSEARAKSVVDYLIEKGVATDHLLSRGYGETKLLVSDDEIAKMKSKDEQEVGHQKNRRTAFRVVKEDELKELQGKKQ